MFYLFSNAMNIYIEYKLRLVRIASAEQMVGMETVSCEHRDLHHYLIIILSHLTEEESLLLPQVTTYTNISVILLLI